MSSTINEGGRTPGADEHEPADAARALSGSSDPLFELFQARKTLDRLTDRSAQHAEPAHGFGDEDDLAGDYTVVYPTGGLRIPEQVGQSADDASGFLSGLDASSVPAEPATVSRPGAPAEPAQPKPAAAAQPAPADTVKAPTDTAKAPAKPAASRNFGDKVSWRDTVPYEETGILIRPADWSTDRIETALINVGALREAVRSGHARSAGARRTGLKRFIPAPRRAILFAILCLQAFLTLRNNNTAFEDEALYLYSGHLELAHLLTGQPVDNFAAYFSGAPVLYPVLGAIADQIGGLFTARLLSLIFMLSATGLVYLTGRRLFDVRSALCGAGLFGTAASVIFMGGLATYDAACVFLLALSAWIVVRGAKSSWPFYVLAVLPMLLAAATKYASLLFVPTIVVLACLAAVPHHGWRWALVRPTALTAMFASMTYGALKLAGPTYVHGIEQTTTARAQGGTPTELMLAEIAKWGGPVFAAALVGGAYFVFRYRPQTDSHPRFGIWARATLVVLLLITALLAPANQLRLHTDVSLQKHVGFGLLFAAPLAGYGLVRLVGSHFGRLQLGIGVAVTAFAFGMSQSHIMFHDWSNSSRLVSTIKAYQKPGGHYLVEVDEVPIYYLRGDTDAEPSQFTSTFYFLYLDWQGQWMTGDIAYQTAVEQGYFQIVAINESSTPGVDQAILRGLHSPISPYRIVSEYAVPTSFGPSIYQIWVKK